MFWVSVKGVVIMIISVILGSFCLSRFIGNEVKAALHVSGCRLIHVLFVDFLQALIHVCISSIMRSLLMGRRRLLVHASLVMIFEYVSYRFWDWKKERKPYGYDLRLTILM